MKKLFLLLLSATIFSCSSELYENEIVVKEGLAYKKDSNNLYSGLLVDKYGEILGTYKKGIIQPFGYGPLNLLPPSKPILKYKDRGIGQKNTGPYKKTLHLIPYTEL